LKYLIFNLKGTKTYDEITEYLNNITNLKIDEKHLKFIISPANIYLPLFKNSNLTLSTQDINIYENLELTGDTSIKALKSLGVSYTLIGHYERKKYYQETEYQIINKIKTALRNNLKVIYFIGETKEELMRKVEYQVLERSLAKILNNLNQKDFQNIIIAYEPCYMIGTNSPLNTSNIREKINFIKTLIQDYYHENLKVIYGGNITPENIHELTKIKELDGYIISSSILDIKNANKIINYLNNN